MKATRASVAEYVKDKGYEPVQIDGIPEGFSFKEADVTIDGKDHKGRIITFKPLEELTPHYE